MIKNETILQLHNVSVRYGGVKALDGVNFSIDEGEIVAIMGPNGSGKSTLLKAIFGLTPIHSGRVLWHGEKIIPVSHEIAQRGVAFVPQGRRVFGSLTVEENLEIGGYIVSGTTQKKKRIAEMMEIFPVLKQKRKVKAGTLSGGQQQMLALARGLMTEPRVLLLDEPSLGLAPKVVKEVFAKIHEINKRHHTAIIVVEHNIKSLLDIANRGYLLSNGKVVLTDASQSLIKSGVLEKVFVGKLAFET